MVSDEVMIRGIEGVDEADELLTRYFEGHERIRYHGISGEDFSAPNILGVYFTSVGLTPEGDRRKCLLPIHISFFSELRFREDLPRYLEGAVSSELERHGL